MKTLYIIGNGFDLYHGLDTKYVSFGRFLKQNYINIYDQLLEFYGFCNLGDEGDQSQDTALWADFENSLALIDFDSVFEANRDYIANPGSAEFRDRDWGAFSIEMERVVGELSIGLFTAFKEFILQVQYPHHIKSERLLLNSESYFLSFNFTDTLERFYQIGDDQIRYIHGKATLDDDELILGHGIDPSNFEDEPETPPENLSEEELERWEEVMSDNYDLSFELGKQEFEKYFLATFKPTEDVIMDNWQFFNQLSDVRNVYVLGHSMSEVDLPYFEEVKCSIQDGAKWTATYYGGKELKGHKNTLLNLNIRKENIKLIGMEELKQT